MEKEETSRNDLSAALVEFQAAVPVIAKTQTAKIAMKSGGNFSYTYANLSDIWDAIRTPLKNNGLAVTQGLIGGSDGWTGIKTTIWHKSGQTFSETVQVPTQGKTAQEVGSQITYYKRYSLAAALGISTEEDDDGQAGNAKPTAALKKAPAAESSDDVLTRAKTKIKEVLVGQGYKTPGDMKSYINGVLGHDTINNLNEADQVGDALRIEK